jgi:hypothetical protein
MLRDYVDRGLTWRQIARKHGYSGPSGAWQQVYRYLDSMHGEASYRYPHLTGWERAMLGMNTVEERMTFLTQDALSDRIRL